MTAIPAGAAVPQDHKSPAQREAEHETTTTIDYAMAVKGDKVKEFRFVIPSSLDDSPVEVMEAFELGRAAQGLAAILGAKQWGQFKKERPTVGQLNELTNVVAKAMGMEALGE